MRRIWINPSSQTFLRRHCRSPVARDHPSARQTGRSSNSKPGYACLGELEGLLCHHRKPGCRSPRLGRVQIRGPFHALVVGLRGNPLPSRAGRTNGTGGGRGGIPCIGCPLAGTGNQDGVRDHCFSFHSEWNVNGGSRVA